MNDSIESPAATEVPVPRVKGTADWLPDDNARLDALEAQAIERFARAGYDRLRTPVLEHVELHERKSGAGIVSKLFELSGTASGRICLRPEMTAGIVRAYAAAEPPPALPWRVSHAGTAFRHESSTRSDRLREFRQVGVERLGDGGPYVDAEVISLACWTLAELGVQGAIVRIGDVGLILEMLARSGLPSSAQSALVEMLSDAAADGGDVDSLGRGLGRYREWLRQASTAEEIGLPVESTDDGGIDRLFRTLVPVVNGRREGHEIIRRLRRKWDLGHGWLGTLDRVRDQVRALAELKGPPGEVLDRLSRDYGDLAPVTVASLRSLVLRLGDSGVPPDRLELDLGFGRGIGFYSQMVFEIVAPTSGGPVEVCGGGRYDGLARVLGCDRDDRGVGFAFGLERLDEALEAQGRRPPPREVDGVLVVPSMVESFPHAARLANQLRSQGVRTILEPETSRVSLIDRAAEVRVSRVVVVGDPRDDGSLILQDRRTGATERIAYPDLIRLVARPAGESKK
jgi:histidyl-tRNA synthetase